MSWASGGAVRCTFLLLRAARIGMLSVQGGVSVMQVAVCEFGAARSRARLVVVAMERRQMVGGGMVIREVAGEGQSERRAARF